MRLVMPGCVKHVRSMPMLRLLLLVTAMGLYLSMGATVFQAIEEPADRVKDENIRKAKTSFLQDHPCISGMYFPYVKIQKLLVACSCIKVSLKL
ncbi:unnamed protein product [Pieris macdunnoughi]|uniref:Uncharacterized protein n=1 Tax=Pieris macdunnoughi TaxID=345717 RepID=A0A821S7J4_9NEOP|nr:unnamed protein product [Pieris macdunnoughi]